MAHTSTESHGLMVHLGARGRLVLPALIRKTMELQEGDPLILSLETPGVLRLTSARQAARAGRGILKATGRQLSEELIRERREEAERG